MRCCCCDDTAVLWGEPRGQPPPLTSVCVSSLFLYVRFQVFMHTHTHTYHHQISLGVHTVHLTVFLSPMRSLSPAFAALSCEPRPQTKLHKVATSCLSLFSLSSRFLFQKLKDFAWIHSFNHCSRSFKDLGFRFTIINIQKVHFLQKTKGTHPRLMSVDNLYWLLYVF